MEGDLPESFLTGMREQSSLAKITLEHGKWSRSLAGLNNGISKCLAEERRGKVEMRALT